MTAVATLVTLAVILTRKDVGYSLVVIWALAGIIVKQIEVQNIVSTAAIGSVIVLVTLTPKLLRASRF